MSGVTPGTINVLVLGAGPPEPQSDPQRPPVWLTEVGGTLLVERIVAACAPLGASRLIFVVRPADVRRHHIDKILGLLAGNATVLQTAGETAGAACTALLAVEYIEPDDELLILNANEILDLDAAAAVASFRERGLDAGSVIFPSVHPRYSYVDLDGNDLVVEAAEKMPISRNATAGFYWYRRGADFVAAAQEMIRKGAHVDGVFYICPAFNELVLRQARIGVVRIDAAQYRPIKSQRQVDSFERDGRSGRDRE